MDCRLAVKRVFKRSMVYFMILLSDLDDLAPEIVNVIAFVFARMESGTFPLSTNTS